MMVHIVCLPPADPKDPESAIEYVAAFRKYDAADMFKTRLVLATGNPNPPIEELPYIESVPLCDLSARFMVTHYPFRVTLEQNDLTNIRIIRTEKATPRIDLNSDERSGNGTLFTYHCWASNVDDARQQARQRALATWRGIRK